MAGLDPDTLLREVTWLRRLAHRLVADDATADDLAGDALAALSAQATPPRSRRGWLATVLRHRAERQQQRDTRRRRSERSAARDEHLPPVDESLAKAQLHRAVVDAVLALQEPYRSAVVLRYLDDLPLHEVAARLQVPTETARTRIKRGLDQLRQKLDHRYGDRAAWAALLLPLRPLRPATPPLPLLTLLMGTKSLLLAAAVAAAAVAYMVLPEPPRPTSSPIVAAAQPDPIAIAADAAMTPAAPERRLAVKAATAPSADVATIVIRGRAIDETSRLPLAAVTVRWLLTDAVLDGACAAASTGADGRFTFTTVKPSPQVRPVLLLRADDHALTTQDLGTPSDGKTSRDYDVGDVLLPPGTALCGTVVDSGGEPAADTPLFAMLFSYWTEAGRIVRLEEALPVGRTAADGSFRLDDRLLPNRPDPLLLAAGPRGVGFVELACLHRERSDASVAIRLLPTTTLDVHVADERGAAVADALVVAEPRFVPLLLPGTYPIHVEKVPLLADCFCARTDSDGVATLQPLALQPGDATPYTLRIEAEGRDRSVVPVQLPHQGTVEVVLPKTRQLQVRGHVRDTDGRPIAGFHVAARWGARTEAASGDDGSYALALARGDGPLQLAVSARGWFPQQHSLQPEAAQGAVTVDFALQPAITLAGRIVDQDGRPVAGAYAWLVGGDPQSVQSAADGTFAMPVPPASPRVLHVWPPDPDSAFAGGLDHLLAPGQSTVTLVLTRLPPDRSALEVEVTDAQGRPLDLSRVALERQHDGSGVWHPATATIGRITASDLPPGDWSLRLDPAHGPELTTTFRVPPGGETVHLQLLQPLAGSAHGEVQLADDGSAPPAEIDVYFRDGGQRARFQAADGQQLLTDGRRLRLDPRLGLDFVIVDVDPSRPLAVVAETESCSADAEVQVTAGVDAAMRLCLRPRAQLQLHSDRPFASDRLSLQLRRPGAPWGEPVQCEGLCGRTDLVAVPVPAGTWEWRVALPTRGDDNRDGAGWQTGRCDVAPGATAVITLPSP